jgi:hypothetical protein
MQNIIVTAVNVKLIAESSRERFQRNAKGCGQGGERSVSSADNPLLSLCFVNANEEGEKVVTFFNKNKYETEGQFNISPFNLTCNVA